MSVKFTPGPWFYDEKNNAIRQCAGENGNLFICGIDDRSRTDTANAKLIAAAPELLAALRQCYSDLQRYAPNSAGSVSARLALLKAQGEVK